MKQARKKVSIIVSLCSIQFYLAMQTVGQTEATFSSQVSTEQVVSAAIVFPKTIQQLEIAAKDHSTRANHLYKTILQTSINGNCSELSSLLTTVLNEEQELNNEIKSLQSIQEQLNSYHNQIHELSETEQSNYEYERKGYQVVNQLIQQLNETINLQKIASIKSTIQSQLGESKEMINNDTSEPKNATDSAQGQSSNRSDTDSIPSQNSNNSDTDSIQSQNSNNSDTDSIQSRDSNNSDTDSIPNQKSNHTDIDSVPNQDSDQTNTDSVLSQDSDHTNTDTISN
ncbi:hypothetical protein COJ46_05450 [Bacillus sp. AFS077874]|uniref:DUF4047 domain-containing protein n=1 Tax=unclassified Bacillus (in: firmicutes) TaxID=185979 RepID=UPI000BECAC02|nr:MULTISPECIES: DUF4047 domain-containing protein [unclassified Bacillus (in: firmicutes)]PEC49330.1 hypothetical protein CON00_11650 [Bacillus sp. AFS096315]PFM82424.1 hypothetical protein COJ46_05450 [Bacillus sp. AFS077874]